MRLNFGVVRNRTPALPPLVVTGEDIVGNENDVGGPADELVLAGIGLGSDEREHGIAVRRSDCDPSLAGLDAGVEDDPEAELVAVELEAQLLVTDKHIDAVEPEKRIGRLRHRVHGLDYKVNCVAREN